MMKKIVKYHKDTLGIECVITCTEDQVELQQETGFELFEVDNTCEVSPKTHYGKAWRKNNQDYSVSVSGLCATITGLKKGTIVSAEGRSTESDSSPTRIHTDRPGALEISISGKPKYFDESIEVDFV